LIRSKHEIIFNEIIKFRPDEIGERLMNDLTLLISTLLHESILRALNESNDTNYTEHIRNEMSAISSMIAKFEKFDPYLDQQFMIDFSKLMQQLHQSQSLSSRRSGILISAYNFMRDLIRANHPCVNSLVKEMDFTLLGYMYNYLASTRTSPQLIEAIAEVLIAYDDLDYPYIHRLENSLYFMLDSVLDWTFSRSKNLHVLALISIKKIFSNSNQLDALSVMQKSCLSTGFIHMLFNDPQIIDSNTISVRSILATEELRYNPLYEHLLKRIATLGEVCNTIPVYNLPPSPELSFESVEDQSNDDSIDITRILENLSDDVLMGEMRMPENIILARALDGTSSEGPLSSSTEDWERRAYETSQSQRPKNVSLN